MFLNLINANIYVIPTKSIVASLFLNGEDNDYTLSKIVGHNVVITDMLSSFPNIRVSFIVGIASSIPTSKNNIRLSDIVISSLHDNTSSKGNIIETKIKTILDKYTELSEEFSRLDEDKDYLYKASVIYLAEVEVERRVRLLREEKRTIIYYSIIASSVLYFEIEAIGLMNYLLCLVIRSIYDYSDSHKNKD
ncbi:hypothetical protein M438DRAFT_378858 [Aureobasidium pullulans EXF-150]|uniref:Uncharacterized protein n=1 Tax=Aureobasidium pullulans EXF-150 TaxID=1043002 RepID=A0A074XV31_AURPU|nr:uncharacterized protein M438DRAFT_378858 [Aureobasidium pullulans EXF-150]KEQ78481.1 hypothetical protein M438DRAFT_378858 [Aureobasidium pullulans EXF-150]